MSEAIFYFATVKYLVLIVSGKMDVVLSNMAFITVCSDERSEFAKEVYIKN